jgi:hypothetical protein
MPCAFAEQESPDVGRANIRLVFHRPYRICGSMSCNHEISPGLPGDIIGIREERCRTLFIAPIDRVYRQIVAWNVDAGRQQRRTARSRRLARSMRLS